MKRALLIGLVLAAAACSCASKKARSRQVPPDAPGVDARVVLPLDATRIARVPRQLAGPQGGDVVHFLHDGQREDGDDWASLFDAYAAALTAEPALGLRLLSAPPSGVAAGNAAQVNAVAVKQDLITRGVAADRLAIEIGPEPSHPTLHSVTLVLGPAAPPKPPAAGPIPDDAPQLVIAVIDDWDASQATLTRHEREPGGAWRAVGDPTPAVIGHAGAAWGRGLHGDGAGGHAGPIKQEGDGRSPAGAFRVLRAFGFDAAPAPGATLPYTAIDDAWRCVDDPASSHYNQVLDTSGVAVDWASAEDMRSSDQQYRWVVELDHNRASTEHARPGAGSCIFLHVWDAPDSTGTIGCTAMAEPTIAALIGWLRPGAIYVLLPRAERDALAAAWHLP